MITQTSSTPRTRVKYTIASHTALGKRPNQEDVASYRVVQQNPLLLAVAAVADGMGGHAAGEVAARIAVDAVVGPDRMLTLLERFHLANDEVRKAAQADRAKYDMGCTMTALTLRTGSVSWCHLGDSRLQLVRDGELRWLTTDHTVGGAQHKIGAMMDEEYDAGGGLPGLLGYVGMPTYGAELPVECGSTSIQKGDVLLLTSDGVHGPLRRAAILECVARSRDGDLGGAGAIACDLVESAVVAGGRHTDNATCIAILVGDLDPLGRR